MDSIRFNMVLKINVMNNKNIYKRRNKQLKRGIKIGEIQKQLEGLSDSA